MKPGRASPNAESIQSSSYLGSNEKLDHGLAIANILATSTVRTKVLSLDQDLLQLSAPTKNR
jgi:hypothetical protein